MNKLFIFFALLLSFFASGQDGGSIQRINVYGISYKVIGADTSLIIPRILRVRKNDSSYVFLGTQNGKAYIFDSTVSKNWIPIGSGFDSTFDATEPSTSAIPGLGGVTLGTTDVKATLAAIIYPSQVPTASLTLTYSGSTATNFELEKMASGANLPMTLNWVAGRQIKTATLAMINVNGSNQSFTQPSAGASVSGSSSVSIPRNTNTTFTITVATTDSKIASASASVLFSSKLYYGFVSSQSPSDANIRGLTQEFIHSRQRGNTSELSPTGSQYFCIAMPEEFDPSNISKIWIGGLDQTSSFVRTVRSFTNVSGFTSNYIIWVTNNLQSGSIYFNIQ